MGHAPCPRPWLVSLEWTTSFAPDSRLSRAALLARRFHGGHARTSRLAGLPIPGRCAWKSKAGSSAGGAITIRVNGKIGWVLGLLGGCQQIGAKTGTLGFWRTWRSSIRYSIQNVAQETWATASTRRHGGDDRTKKKITRQSSFSRIRHSVPKSSHAPSAATSR